jgi:integral membrane protein (TIGR01906 family)
MNRKRGELERCYDLSKEQMKKITTAFSALIHAVAVLTGSVLLGLNTRFLYYINIPKIQAQNGDYDYSLIKRNYDILIDYLNPFYRGPLKLDGLVMSPQGEFHFYEVKVIFDLLFILFIVSLILSVVLFMKKKKERKLGYLKGAAALTFILPVLLGIPFLVDFSKAFVVFHEIAFSNDYWIFDPRIDPIIKILPEWFFMYAAFLILIYMILFAVLTLFIERTFGKKKHTP